MSLFLFGVHNSAYFGIVFDSAIINKIFPKRSIYFLFIFCLSLPTLKTTWWDMHNDWLQRRLSTHHIIVNSSTMVVVHTIKKTWVHYLKHMQFYFYFYFLKSDIINVTLIFNFMFLKVSTCFLLFETILLSIELL